MQLLLLDGVSVNESAVAGYVYVRCESDAKAMAPDMTALPVMLAASALAIAAVGS